MNCEEVVTQVTNVTHTITGGLCQYIKKSRKSLEKEKRLERGVSVTTVTSVTNQGSIFCV